MRTLKISLIATAIATGFSFWAGRFGVMQKLWPEHPQLAGFFLTLAICIAVQIVWPKEWLGGHSGKS
jgi:NO-binding membrane sensor protein with MHYT domain